MSGVNDFVDNLLPAPHQGCLAVRADEQGRGAVQLASN